MVFLVLGAAAGLLAGLLGIGGGLIIVAALAWLLPLFGHNPATAMHTALATSLASILFTATASAWAHHRRGSVLWPTAFRLMPGLVAGGVLGAWYATTLSGAVLRWLVAGYCLIAAAQLGFGRAPVAVKPNNTPRSLWLMVTGVLIGAVSAIVGIGGGSMTVPVLIRLGVAPVRAVGTSSTCGVAIALAGAAGYFFFAPADHGPAGTAGYLYLPAVSGIGLAALATAPLGTRIAHAIGGTALRRVFAAFLALMGVSLLRMGI